MRFLCRKIQINIPFAAYCCLRSHHPPGPAPKPPKSYTHIDGARSFVSFFLRRSPFTVFRRCRVWAIIGAVILSPCRIWRQPRICIWNSFLRVCSAGVHRTFIWYDYAYLLTFYSFLLLLLLTSPPMLSLASTSAFCYILQYNVRYLFDICSFLLLLFPKYTLGVSSSKWFLKSHLHCANDIVRETWIWYVIFRGCCRRRRRQRCSLLFLIIFSMPI